MDAEATNSVYYEQILISGAGHSYGTGNICTVCGCFAPIVIEMTDSYGDGWNGNKILVYQNDILLQEVTVENGKTGTVTIEYDPCNHYRFVWQKYKLVFGIQIKLNIWMKAEGLISNLRRN